MNYEFSEITMQNYAVFVKLVKILGLNSKVPHLEQAYFLNCLSKKLKNDSPSNLT